MTIISKKFKKTIAKIFFCNIILTVVSTRCYRVLTLKNKVLNFKLFAHKQWNLIK